MSHTYVANRLHIVFSTKQRKRLIEPEFQPRLWSYFAGIARNNGMYFFAAGGVEDHAHILVSIAPTMPISKAVQLLKGSSSKWIGEHGIEFAWQEGYSAFSVSASQVGTVVEYIKNQAEHHRKRRFEDELVALLRKNGIEFDPKYVFG